MKFTYVGVDSHKETHTAVFLDCFFERLGEVSFGNLPKDFSAFLDGARKLRQDGTAFQFGMEDPTKYGRALARFLIAGGHPVKHVNAYLVARERRSLNYEKSDSADAECAARLLISRFGGLPDAEEDGRYHILRTLVVRRDSLTKSNVSLKGYLHSLLTLDFPGYQRFFRELDGKTALAFFTRYPSPNLLTDTTADELARFLWEHSGGLLKKERAKEILDAVGEAAGTAPIHPIRNKTVLSTIRQLQYNLRELESVEADLFVVYSGFDTTLTSMAGLDLVSASQLLSCIGDVRKFPTPAKLAKYAGVAPVTHASGKRGVQFANTRGDRELNSLFYRLALRLILTVEPGCRALNPFFHEYYRRKLTQGKTKGQALKCVQRRLVNIVWTMLTNHEDYVNPPIVGVERPETADGGKPEDKRRKKMNTGKRQEKSKQG